MATKINYKAVDEIIQRNNQGVCEARRHDRSARIQNVTLRNSGWRIQKHIPTLAASFARPFRVGGDV